MVEMFEVRKRLASRERAILVGVEWSGRDRANRDADESLAELAALAATAGVEVICQVLHNRSRPDPTTFIGSGKAEELRVLNQEARADVFLFDDDLSPAQIRNLERILDAKVLDRTDLILDIFAQRARTREAKLQVELAQLEYALPRLTRHWTHLSRLGGGSGVGGGVGTRGPGETQLQMDRRWIRGRVSGLRSLLTEVSQHRDVQRKGRSELFSAALVGYTNAGKSSLMNALLGSEEVRTESKLFSTLDPTTRLLRLPDGHRLTLTDTVGFIERLPHRLVAAFRATLEEVCRADLLIHVVDVSHPRARQQNEAVNAVLTELGAADIPAIMALNKIDLLTAPAILLDVQAEFPDAVPISARTGEGLDSLRQALSLRVAVREERYTFRLPQTDARLLSYLYEHGRIETVEYREADITVRASLAPQHLSPVRAYLETPDS